MTEYHTITKQDNFERKDPFYANEAFQDFDEMNLATKGLDEDNVERLMCTEPSRKVTRWQRERPYISMALDMRTLQLLTR